MRYPIRREPISKSRFGRHGIQPIPLLRKEGEGEVEALIGYHGYVQLT
jgi:hypothetical protein